MMRVNILALLGYLTVANGDMPMIGVGLGNVKHMTENAPVTIETGSVPTWLSGELYVFIHRIVCIILYL